MGGITITQFLVSGDPKGIICAYISNWTGQSIKIPRNLLEDAKSREEVDRSGVYFLIGSDEKNPDNLLLYIGESENLFIRLLQHKNSDKEFWESAICFSSKDDNLTKAHVKHLEYKLIQIAASSPNYNLKNKNAAAGSPLPETAVADMDAYLDNMKIILPTLGVNLFDEKKPGRASGKNELIFKAGEIKATGQSVASGFMVYSGSKVKKVKKEIKSTLPNGYKNLRDNLIEKGIITEEDNKLVFAKAYEFKSPSAASSVIIGYPTNGRDCWKNKDGKSLKEIEKDKISSMGINRGSAKLTV